MKCSNCGRELVTGDIHWEQGLCNQCWNVYRHEKMPIPQYVDMLNKEIYELQNENLKQQLAEKDKEIEKLNRMLATLPQHDDELRHQICEEIRKKIEDIDNLELSSYRAICKILDKIEKGETE